MPSSISFRPLARADFPLLQRWIATPHVAVWWHEPFDQEAVNRKYGPRVDGADPTFVFVIEKLNQPVGWIQWYRWADYPEHAQQLGAEPESAGIDLAIGEPDMVDAGIGTIVIGRFLNEVIFVDPAISAVVTDPEETNLRSIRAFQKAGFVVTHPVELRGESFRRSVIRLNRRPAGAPL